MRTVELTPKAQEDLESIWLYSFERYGEAKADYYITRFSDIFSVISAHNVGTLRPELGDGICSLPVDFLSLLPDQYYGHSYTQPCAGCSSPFFLELAISSPQPAKKQNA